MISRPPHRPRILIELAALLLGLPAAILAEEPPGVIVAEVQRVSFPLTVEALGTAIANESVEIRAQVSETVVGIRFTEGQQVNAGDMLVELRNSEALAAVAAARANLVDSEGKYARAERMLASELVSESELEALRARRDADRAAVDAAESRLAETVVRAPFAGRVGLRRVSVGSLVGPTTVITTLDDTDPIKVDFEVSETAFSLLAEGLPIEATSAAWPDTVFLGRVVSIDTRIDPVSRTVTLRALLPNSDDLLRPGMFLTVRVLRRDVTALMVPEQALIPEQSRQYVLVVGDGGVVEKREVQAGRRWPGAVEIVTGLSGGEMVIAEGTQKARPGDTVSVLDRIEVTP
jgi:membrane fusion protein (multidrug efflux system)